MKLDDRNVAALALVAGKSEGFWWDDDLPRFGLRWREGGKRTWIVQYRVGKLTKRLTLGPVDKSMDAGAARKAAVKALSQVNLGADPQAAKVERLAKAAETFGSFTAAYLAHQAERLKPRSLEQITAHLEKHWGPFQAVSIHAIDRKAVSGRLGKIISERGNAAANRARTSLSGFFSWAIGEGHVDANPVTGTNLAEEAASRDRVLGDEELVDIWHACRDDDFGRTVKLLLLTATRRDEAGGMLKSEIDLPGRKWSIGEARTKNRRPLDMPLSDLALGVIGEALTRGGRDKRDAVFGDGGAGLGFSGWSKAKGPLDDRINAARADAGREPIKPWILHDLRRTAATRMAELGTLPHVVEAVLNHVSGHKAGVAGVYNRASYWNEKRIALDLWADHIAVLVAGKASNIVKLRT
jgi:integrase